MIEFEIPNPSAKQEMNLAWLSLKIPPQANKPGLPTTAPSELHLIQLIKGGFQMISLIVGALGGWLATLKALRRTRSDIEELETLETIWFTADFQLVSLILNLALFLASQTMLKMLIKAALITSLHCFELPLSHNFQISSRELNCIVVFKTDERTILHY